MSPLRVLCVIDGLGRGGAEHSLAELAAPLRERGLELSIAVSRRRAGQEDRLRTAGHDVFHLQGRTLLGRGLSLHHLVRSETPDVVHTTLVTSSIMARLALARSAVPILTSLVNTTYTPPARLGRPGLRRLVVRATDSWTARRYTTAFHALSQAVADDAVNNLGIDAGAVSVIARGRSRERLGWPSADRRRAAREALGLAELDEVILCVGREEHQKSHVTLVRAFAAVAAQRPRARLLIAGREGLATPAIREAIDALDPSTRSRVERMGHVVAIGDVLAAADIFAFPSLHEGLAGAVIEALALGLPVVVRDLPVFREYLRPDENAILVAGESAGAWATAIGELLADPERRQAMGAANMARFEERFALDRIADQMADLYREVVVRGRARGPRRH